MKKKYLSSNAIFFYLAFYDENKQIDVKWMIMIKMKSMRMSMIKILSIILILKLTKILVLIQIL